MQLTVQASARARPAPFRQVGLAARLLACALATAVVLTAGEQPRELRVRQAVAPSSFVLLDWEVARLSERASRITAGLVGQRPPAGPEGRAAVAAYFAAAPSEREPLRASAEAAIEVELTDVLAGEGLVTPLPLAPGGSVVFPPVSFSFVSPPRVLVVSPRDRIAVVQSELLRPDVTPERVESLESAVDSQDVSSLVVSIGGLATYPSMVLQGTRPRDALVGVAHEWIHGYLFFHPLGRAYWSSAAARAINETATDMASRELGEALARALGQDTLAVQPTASPAAGPPAGRAFRDLMRATRIEVDRLLAAGKVGQAEAYMRDRREDLVAAGYDIRKLNQAYFAFYGSYGDAAAGSSPIPGRLKRLRDASPSVGDFLRRVAQLTNGDDLARAVGDA